MLKIKLLLIAMLGMCAAMMTSCSHDVVDNPADGNVPATKSPSVIPQVNTIALTVDGFTEYDTLTYTNGKLSAFRLVFNDTARIGTVTRTQNSVVVVCEDEFVGDTTRYTYNLNDEGYVINALAVDANDPSAVFDGMICTYNADGTLLTGIQVLDTLDIYFPLYTFTYNTVGNFSTVDGMFEGAANCTPSTYLNRASIDLNWYCMLAAEGMVGDIFMFAVLADLLPNANLLVNQARYNNNNYATYTYTQVPVNKTTACTITTVYEGESFTSSVAFGY